MRSDGGFHRAPIRQEKLRRNAVDFSDQEHYAIELLTQPDGAPTELARQMSARYQEIMVDEYQDTNEVQNCHLPGRVATTGRTSSPWAT